MTTGGSSGEAGNLAGHGVPPKTASGPNVILIVTDDQGCGDFGFMGNADVQTPNMDRLAREGALFGNFHTTPVCAPTRAGLMTGRHHQRTGVRTNVGGWEFMEGDEVTIAERLRDAGVRTGAFGKWHLGEHHPSDPNGQGFEEYLGVDGGSSSYFDPVLQHNRTDASSKGYLTDILTDAAINFIAAHKQEQFFVYLPYNAPHDPFEAPADLLALYETKFHRQLATVYAMVTSVDRNIGRLLESLQANNLNDNTVVILTSDNGPTGPDRFNCDLSGRKSSVTEGGVRVPLVFWGSGIPRKKVNSLAFHLDLFPTLLEFASLMVPSETEIDGMSLKPLIDQENTTWPERKMFMNFSRATERDLAPPPQPGGVAWFGRYKMLGGDQLYDLETDPSEVRNLAADKPELLAEMNNAYLSWFQGVIQEKQPLVPVEVGHEQENPVRIATHNAQLSGGLQYGYGESNYKRDRPIHGDWVTNWKGPEAKLELRLRVAKTAEYRISLRLRCAPEQAGTPFVISLGSASAMGTISACAGPQEWVEGSAVQMKLEMADRVGLVLQAPDHLANAGQIADISHVIVQRL